jgi:hypothetical protein
MMVAAGAIIALLQCANPVDEPPLAWKSNVAAPLTNEHYFIGEKFDDLFDFKNDLEIIKGDTISFAVSRNDTATYERTEKTFDTMFYRVKLGILSIQGAPEQNYSIPSASAGTFIDTFSVPLQKIKNIVFYDTANNFLDFELSNNSDVSLSNVDFGIVGLGSGHIDALPAQSSHVFSYNVAGKSINDSLTFIMGLTSPDATPKTLRVKFSFNGVKVFSMNVLDSLLAYSREYVNRYELTDSINIDYVDLQDGMFIYKILNQSGVSFSLSCVHDHIWDAGYCESVSLRGLGDFKTLTTPVDSSKFKGTIPNTKINAAPSATEVIQIVNLSDSRLFTEWDTTINKSITNVRYTVATNPTGRYTTVSALDSLKFTIATLSFKFKRIAGTFTEPMEYEADTEKVAIDLPWNTTVKDSLRGKFILKNVWADLELKTKMTADSHIDTLGIDFIAFDPESTVVRDSLITRFVNVSNDSVYSRAMNIADVANCFSDSIAIAVRVHIPTGTKFKFTNTTDLLDNNIIGKMVIDAYTNFRLNAKLDWEVDDTVNMDLGSSRTKLPEAFQYFRKMQQRSGTFEMWVRNNTNLNVSLFALVAPDALMDTLDSLSMNKMYAYLKSKDKAISAGYIDLFGENGVKIPQRDTTTEYYDTVELNELQIQKLVSADSLNFRWWIQFKPQPRDALKKKDFIDIKSRLGIRGTNNTDSLLIWK